jgi:hypothetical protein
MGQVGIWETNESELLMNASRASHDVKTMSVGKSWDESDGKPVYWSGGIRRKGSVNHIQAFMRNCGNHPAR